MFRPSCVLPKQSRPTRPGSVAAEPGPRSPSIAAARRPKPGACWRCKGTMESQCPRSARNVAQDLDGAPSWRGKTRGACTLPESRIRQARAGCNDLARLDDGTKAAFVRGAGYSAAQHRGGKRRTIGRFHAFQLTVDETALVA